MDIKAATRGATFSNENYTVELIIEILREIDDRPNSLHRDALFKHIVDTYIKDKSFEYFNRLKLIRQFATMNFDQLSEDYVMELTEIFITN